MRAVFPYYLKENKTSKSENNIIPHFAKRFFKTSFIVTIINITNIVLMIYICSSRQ